MNIAQVAEALKTAPDQYLVSAVQGQNPNAPGYLALAEMQRRQQLRQGQQAQAPMTTVAQDESRQAMPAQMMPVPPQQAPQGQSAMGIGGVKRFADGGIVYGGEYGGGNVLPDTTGYEGQSGTSAFADLMRKLYLKYQGLQESTAPQYLKEAAAAKAMQGYVPRRTDQGAPQWTVNPPGIGGTAPTQEAPIPDISIQSQAKQPPGIGSVSASASRQSSAGGRGAGATLDNVQIPAAPDIGYKDASEYLGKVPTNKILDQLAQEAGVNKKKFEDQRDEIKNAALAKFGALIASRPGGFGGNFAQAVSGAMDYRRAGMQDIDKLERQAEMDRRQVLLAQAANEDARYARASDLSKEEYNAKTNDFARKFGVSKEQASIAMKQAEMNNALQIAREHNAAIKESASMRVGAGNENAIIRAFTQAKGQADAAAKAAMQDQMKVFQLQKKYGTKNPDEIQSRLTKDYYETAVRNHPFLSQYADEMGIGAAPAAPTGPSFAAPPQGAVIRR